MAIQVRLVSDTGVGAWTEKGCFGYISPDFIERFNESRDLYLDYLQGKSMPYSPNNNFHGLNHTSETQPSLTYIDYKLPVIHSRTPQVMYHVLEEVMAALPQWFEGFSVEDRSFVRVDLKLSYIRLYSGLRLCRNLYKMLCLIDTFPNTLERVSKLLTLKHGAVCILMLADLFRYQADSGEFTHIWSGDEVTIPYRTYHSLASLFRRYLTGAEEQEWDKGLLNPDTCTLFREIYGNSNDGIPDDYYQKIPYKSAGLCGDSYNYSLDFADVWEYLISVRGYPDYRADDYNVSRASLIYSCRSENTTNHLFYNLSRPFPNAEGFLDYFERISYINWEKLKHDKT